jgi:hypothetical protein
MYLNVNVKRKVNFFVWLSSIAFIIFFFLYMLPHRGFDYTDEGYYLYDNINLINGIVPQLGYYSILNLIPYSLGLNYYLIYEIYNSLIMVLATSIIFYAYGLHKKTIFPITLIVMLLIPNILMISYQNVPSYLLLISFGLIILSQKKDSFLLSILALFFLSFSSFANIALLPAIISNLMIFMFIDKRRKSLLVIYIAICTLFIYFYLDSPINIFSFIKENPDHHIVGNNHILSNVYQLIHVVFASNNYIFLKLFSFALIVRTVSFNMKKNHHLIHVLIFIVIYIYLLIFIQTSSGLTTDIGFSNVLSLLLASVLLTNKNNKILLAFTFIIIIYSAGLASSGFLNTAYHVSLMGSSALVIIVFFVYSNIKIINHTFQKDALNIAFCFALILVFIALLNTKLNQGWPDESTFNTNAEIEHGFLHGVYTTPSKKKAYNDIISFYNKFECASKPLIAFPAMPLVYAMVDRQAFGNQGWVDPVVGYKVSSNSLLDHTKGLDNWCTVLALQFNSPQDYTQEYKEFVTSESSECSTINYNAIGQPAQFYFCHK